MQNIRAARELYRDPHLLPVNMQARIGKGCSFFVPALSIYQLQYRVTIEYLGQALLMHAILSAAGLEGVVAGG